MAEYPLIEEIYSRQKGAESLRIVFSYLPGRNNSADAKSPTNFSYGYWPKRPRGPTNAILWMLDVVCSIRLSKKIKTDERPVLAAALRLPMANGGSDAAASAASEPWENRGYVLDLHGGAPPPDEFVRGVRRREKDRDSNQRAHAALNSRRQPSFGYLEMARLDRERQKSPRPGVLWLPDSRCPLPWNRNCV